MSKETEKLRVLTDQLQTLLGNIKGIQDTLESLKNASVHTLHDSKGKVKSEFQIIRTQDDTTKENSIKEIELTHDEVKKVITDYLKTVSSMFEGTTKTLLEESIAEITKYKNETNQTLQERTDSILEVLTTKNEELQEVLEKKQEVLSVHEEELTRKIKVLPNEYKDAMGLKLDALESKVRNALEMNEEVLKNAVYDLKNDFEATITDQIQQVYDGVKRMKLELNEIVQDTLKNLEANLKRINEGVDKYFMNQLAQTQDTILAFEERLEETVSDVVQDFKEHSEVLLQKLKEEGITEITQHGQQLDALTASTLTNLQELKEKGIQDIKASTEELNSFLQGVMEQYKSETREFQEKLSEKVKNLDSRITQAREQLSNKVKVETKNAESMAMTSMNEKFGSVVSGIRQNYDTVITENTQIEQKLLGNFESLQKEFEKSLQAVTQKIEKERGNAEKELSRVKQQLQ